MASGFSLRGGITGEKTYHEGVSFAGPTKVHPIPSIPGSNEHPDLFPVAIPLPSTIRASREQHWEERKKQRKINQTNLMVSYAHLNQETKS